MKSTRSSIHFLPASARWWVFMGAICLGLSAGVPPAKGVDTPAKAKTNSAPSPSRVPHAVPAAATNLNQTAGTNQPDLTDRYKLVIGDRLSFRIEEDEDEPRSIIVTDSGDVDVPYIGRVPAESKTCKQLAAEIKAALEKDYYYHATVRIAVDLMSKVHGRVYLVGAVGRPGPVEIPGDEPLTLSKSILRAGGFTDYADRRHVKVTRMGTGESTDKKTFTVNVGEIFDHGKVESDLPLESGDLVYVPERLVHF
jgi:protein involved in polysaccharide export with SLBB domain